MTLAIDPGGTTGMAWRTFDGKVGHAQMPAKDARALAFQTLMLQPDFPPTTIVMESFILHASVLKKSRQGVHDAIETIGAWRTYCEFTGTPFIEQSPAQGKRISNDTLREVGLYVVRLEHARDAARHLALYEMKESMK